MTPAEFRERYAYCLDGRVEWGDMDIMGHVNNTYFFRYFERVRTEYFVDSGLMARMQAHGLGPILASTQCRFRLPLAYPDEIVMGASVTDVSDDRLSMQYAVHSAKAQAVAAEGEGVVVCYDYGAAAKRPWPAPLRDWLERNVRRG